MVTMSTRTAHPSPGGLSGDGSVSPSSRPGGGRRRPFPPGVDAGDDCRDERHHFCRAPPGGATRGGPARAGARRRLAESVRRSRAAADQRWSYEASGSSTSSGTSASSTAPRRASAARPVEHLVESEQQGAVRGRAALATVSASTPASAWFPVTWRRARGTKRSSGVSVRTSTVTSPPDAGAFPNSGRRRDARDLPEVGDAGGRQDRALRSRRAGTAGRRRAGHLHPPTSGRCRATRRRADRQGPRIRGARSPSRCAPTPRRSGSCPAPGSTSRTRGPGDALTAGAVRDHNGTLLLGFDEVRDRSAAEAPARRAARGRRPRRRSDEPDAWYDHQLVGLARHLDRQAPSSARSSRVEHLPAQDLLVCGRPDGARRLVPFVAAHRARGRRRRRAGRRRPAGRPARRP